MSLPAKTALGRCGERDHMAAGAKARLLREVALQHLLALSPGSSPAIGVAVAAQPFLRLEVAFRTGDEGDPAVAALDEVLHHRLRAGVVVDRERRMESRPARRVFMSTAGRSVERLPQRKSALACGDMMSRPSTRPFMARNAAAASDGIAVRARHEQVQAPGPGGQVDAPDELGEILAVQIGQQRADGVRAPRDHAARGTRGHEAELRDDAEHALAGAAAVTLERPFSARETVATETPACRATSLIVVANAVPQPPSPSEAPCRRRSPRRRNARAVLQACVPGSRS